MSHTTTITAIAIRDVQALKMAIKDLQKAGVPCWLAENEVPGAYYKDQEGMNTPAPFVVRFKDTTYGVGLYEDGDGGYVAKADLFGGHIAAHLGVGRISSGESREQAALGKLYQYYAVNATTREAARQGYTVMRSTMNDGTVKLAVNM